MSIKVSPAFGLSTRADFSRFIQTNFIFSVPESPLLARKAVIPIIGASRAAQIEENLACLEFELTDDQIERLDEASRIELGFPHEFLESSRKAIFGEMFPLIDNHHKI